MSLKSLVLQSHFRFDCCFFLMKAYKPFCDLRCCINKLISIIAHYKVQNLCFRSGNSVMCPECFVFGCTILHIQSMGGQYKPITYLSMQRLSEERHKRDNNSGLFFTLIIVEDFNTSCYVKLMIWLDKVVLNALRSVWLKSSHEDFQPCFVFEYELHLTCNFLPNISPTNCSRLQIFLKQ